MMDLKRDEAMTDFSPREIVSQLEAAGAKGVIERNAADNLAEFLIQNRNTASEPDEERLRLITGFNDIFVTIGIALFLGALNYLLGLALRLRRGDWLKFSPKENAWPCRALCCLSSLS